MERHWLPQTDPIPSDLHDVVFTDANTGTAIGPVGLILRTTDGGSSWSPQTSGSLEILYGVSFVDANNGIIVGFGGRNSNDYRRRV